MAQGKGGGRPSRIVVMTREMYKSLPESAQKKTEFQKDLLIFGKDPVVVALKSARKKLFDAADESGMTDITKVLKNRLEELKHRISTPA